MKDRHFNLPWPGLHRCMIVLAAGLLAWSFSTRTVAQDAPPQVPLEPAQPGMPEALEQPPAQAKPYIITLDGMVNEVMQERLQRQIKQAQDGGATVIILEMDTWGGLVGAALEMCDIIKNTKTPIIAWVNPKAISAGAMISVACNEIIVAERGRIGDCAPIAGGGQQLKATEREKIETVIREEFRDSARRNGYSLTLSTAMVTLGPAVYQLRHNDNGLVRYVYEDQLAGYGVDKPNADELPAAIQPKKQEDLPEELRQPEQPGQGVLEELAKRAGAQQDKPKEEPVEEDDGPIAAPEAEQPFDPGRWTLERRVLGEKQLLTMSQSEAIDLGFAKQIVRDDVELAKYLGVQPSDMQRLEANWSEQMVSWLTSPFVRGILTLILLMALYSEMQAPGLGFAGLVAIVAGVILMGAPYLAGLAEAWEIVLVALGLGLLAVEIFVLPGFGVAGISGLILMFVGLLLTFIETEPGPGFLPSLPGTWDALGEGVITIMVAGIASIVGISILTRYFGAIPVLNKIILTAEQNPLVVAGGGATSAGVGGVGDTVNASVGDTGTALGDLRPIGRAEFDGQTLEVTSSGYIEHGATVKITRISGSRIEVEEA
jgi:membrane-bound serine protease (ClpP class)